jgi:hypothetical protein
MWPAHKQKWIKKSRGAFNRRKMVGNQQFMWTVDQEFAQI